MQDQKDSTGLPPQSSGGQSLQSVAIRPHRQRLIRAQRAQVPGQKVSSSDASRHGETEQRCPLDAVPSVRKVRYYGICLKTVQNYKEDTPAA